MMTGSTEQIDTICASLSEGKSLRSIAREIDMAESTLRYWLANDADAFAQSARARDLGCDSLADECLEISDDDTLDHNERRIRIDTRLRLIGKWSSRYSDKVKHVGGDVGDSPIQTVTRIERHIIDPDTAQVPAVPKPVAVQGSPRRKG